MKEKTIKATDTHRLYILPSNELVSCALQHQTSYDDYDGQQPGWYAWCGPVDDQSDYAMGPFATPEQAFDRFEQREPRAQRLREVTLFTYQPPRIVYADGRVKQFEFPPRDHSERARCSGCLKEGMPKWRKCGGRRMYCDECIGT